MPYQSPFKKHTQPALPFGQNNNNSGSSITGTPSEIQELKVLKLKSLITKANRTHKVHCKYYKLYLLQKQLILGLKEELKLLTEEIQWLREDVTDASGLSERESDSVEDQECQDGSETDVDI